MTNPIPPEEISQAKRNSIPDEVFEAFNMLVTNKWDGKSSIVLQSDAVKEIIKRAPKELENLDEKAAKSYMYSHHWLDIEDFFRESGWIVRYDRPAYNGMYEPFFEFSKK